MSPARLFLLFLTCFMDVHVRAETILAADDRRVVTTRAKTKLTLAKGGLAVDLGSGAGAGAANVRLVRGVLYVEGPVAVASPFGSFACDHATCEALITRETERVRIEALSPGWRVTPRGYDSALGVEDATRVALGQVDRSGHAAVEPPQALQWSNLLRTWAQLTSEDFESFATRVRALRPRWDAATERLSEDQRARALASVDAVRRAQDLRAQRAREAAAEDAQLRQLFREKNFVEN